jgi:hypothetical protein
MERPLRDCCADSAAAGACQCRWCGAAITRGRVPTASERRETSLQARRAQLAARLLAPTTEAVVDAHVVAAISAIRPRGRAFHAGELAPLSKRSPIAVRWALARLESRGAVRRADRVRVRTSRWRQLWILDPDAAARSSASADGDTRCAGRAQGSDGEAANGDARA